MTRRLYNWNYRQVTEFLKEKGFSYYQPLIGSHHSFIKYAEDGTPDRIVEINFTHGVYPPKTLKTMIKQSGISQDEWIAWANS